MAVTSGFFNASGGDRTYSADQMTQIMRGIITDGVFKDFGGGLVPRASTGMNIIVASGKAWWLDTWLWNDADLTLAVPAAHLSLNRYDAAILEFDKTDPVRANSIKIISGTAASSPTYPTLVDTATKIQKALCYIYVAAGVTSIVTGNLTIVVGLPETQNIGYAISVSGGGIDPIGNQVFS